jgi:hypothetical protein
VTPERKYLATFLNGDGSTLGKIIVGAGRQTAFVFHFDHPFMNSTSYPGVVTVENHNLLRRGEKGNEAIGNRNSQEFEPAFFPEEQFDGKRRNRRGGIAIQRYHRNGRRP